LREWFEGWLTKLSRKSDTTAAIRYALTLWPALIRCCDDGRLEADNNAAERLCAQYSRTEELSVCGF
jgi:transposase